MKVPSKYFLGAFYFNLLAWDKLLPKAFKQEESFTINLSDFLLPENGQGEGLREFTLSLQKYLLNSNHISIIVYQV